MLREFRYDEKRKGKTPADSELLHVLRTNKWNTQHRAGRLSDRLIIFPPDK